MTFRHQGNPIGQVGPHADVRSFRGREHSSFFRDGSLHTAEAPASLLDHRAAVSMASTGPGHAERKSQIGIGKILRAHRGREGKGEGGEHVHTQQNPRRSREGQSHHPDCGPPALTLGLGSPSASNLFLQRSSLTRTPCSF